VPWQSASGPINASWFELEGALCIAQRSIFGSEQGSGWDSHRGQPIVRPRRPNESWRSRASCTGGIPRLKEPTVLLASWNMLETAF
jgi:hypothetical protein